MPSSTTSSGAAQPTLPITSAAPSLPIFEDLVRQNAAALKQQLLAALDQTEHLHLDLSSVTEIDGPGLQVLLACLHQAKLEEKQLSVDLASDEFTSLATILGLKDLLPKNGELSA